MESLIDNRGTEKRKIPLRRWKTDCIEQTRLFVPSGYENTHLPFTMKTVARLSGVPMSKSASSSAYPYGCV